MEKTTKSVVSWRIIMLEVSAILVLFVFVWLNELLDLPHMLFGAAPTPINTIEAGMESIVVLLLGAVLIRVTYYQSERLAYLEGFVAICSSCKKVNIDNKWISIEEFLATHSEAELSHHLCPECQQKLNSN